jgi:hypothetical protein
MNYCENCGKKVEEKFKFCTSCGGPVIQHTNEKPTPRSEQSYLETTKDTAPFTKPKAPKYIIFGSVIIVILLGIFDFLPATTPITTPPTNHPPTEQKPTEVTITNPTYLKNPSAYVVDKEGNILSNPRGGHLWVEGIVNSNKLLVSYVVNRGGAEILKIETLSIPGLTDYVGLKGRFFEGIQGQGRYLFPPKLDPIPNAQCWENGAKEFLQTHFLHTDLYFYATGWAPKDSYGGDFYLLSYGEVPSGSGSGRLIYFPIADYIIVNGYGAADEVPNQYSYESLTHKYFNELLDKEAVAFLAKRGLWGSCPYERNRKNSF